MTEPTLFRPSPENFMAGLGVPGCWWVWKTPVAGVPMICCPQCKRLIHLLHGYTIAEDGTVTPECVCTTHYCGFKAHVKLEGWTPPPAEEKLP